MLREQTKGLFRRSRTQDLVVLLNQARGCGVGNEMPVYAYGLDDRLFQGEPQACRECHRTKHAHGIFLKALLGIADRANDTILQILQAANIIDDRPRRRIVEKRVDGEISSERVLFSSAERVVMPELQITPSRVCSGRGGGRFVLSAGQNISTKRCDLDGLVAESHVGQTEPAPDDPAVSKELLDLIRVRIGADVEVFGTTPQQQIPDAAADEISREVGFPKSIEDLERVRIDIRPRNRVFCARDDHRLRHPRRIVPRATIPSMSHPHGVFTLAVTFVLAFGTIGSVFAQSSRADLGKARAHYNQREFDEAIVAATAARRTADEADAAAIVLARAHLERYRERADPADLSAARAALALIRASGLDARDQMEFVLALGESLFLEDDFGAAAEMFESGLERAAATDRELGDAMLEWWGSAVERQASVMPREPRVAVFSRLADRMKQELVRNPASAAASYWMAVGLRGAGEPDRAWDAAVAGWLRARLVGERAPALRADLDRLVLRGIIPDRVRHLSQDQHAGAESQLKVEWELVKEKWK